MAYHYRVNQNTMKKILIALALFTGLSANKCKNEAGGMSNIMDTKWAFQSLGGEAVKMPDGVDQPWLQMAGDQLQGFGGCNSLMGSVALEGSKLSFPGLGSTKKYCADVQPTENAIKQALGQVDSFKMDGGLLKLLGGGKELAALKGM